MLLSSRMGDLTTVRDVSDFQRFFPQLPSELIDLLDCVIDALIFTEYVLQVRHEFGPIEEGSFDISFFLCVNF